VDALATTAKHKRRIEATEDVKARRIANVRRDSEAAAEPTKEA
jgi:hypothetical protein